MVDRRTIDVATPAGGWGAPWPNVAEIEAVLSHDKWTLVGGLMSQLHGIHAGIDAVRPTNDVDIVLHVETTRRVAAARAMRWTIRYTSRRATGLPVSGRWMRGPVLRSPRHVSRTRRTGTVIGIVAGLLPLPTRCRTRCPRSVSA